MLLIDYYPPESIMNNFIEEFYSAMSAAGFEPKGGKIIADDKWHQAAYMGEKAGKLSGAYSMKIVSSDFAIGTFFTRKDPDKKHKWHSKSGEKLTPEERKRIKKEIAAAQRKKEIEEELRQVRISKRLERVWEKLPPAPADHPYLVKKGVKPYGLRLRKKGNELVMPLRNDGKIWTIQRITEDGGKYLFAGGRKKGSYYSFATGKDDLSLFLVCEGYATGASIREAMSMPVIAAVDSGNLKPVLISLKAKYPSSRFVICADNDAFTKNAKEELWNVGKEKADEAAVEIGGAFVLLPDFTGHDLASKPTDFNDLHALAGNAAINQQIKQFLDTIPAREEAAIVDDALSGAVDQHHDGGDFSPDEGWEPDYDYAEAAENRDPLKGDFGMNFKVLGYNQGTYYYFPFKERQIVAISAGGHTMQNLFRLDDLDNWMAQFGAGNTPEKKVVMYATNALMQLAKHRGVFKEEDCVRGCGAWMDEGRYVLHCGDKLYVDGYETKFDQIRSEYTYIAEKKLMTPSLDTPLTNREAYRLREICEAVTWENKLSGSLLAGWLVIAPVCGALGFRPHVYITGEAESGKSTVQDKIIKPVLGKMSINADGGTTEPAIRQMMGYDARPLVYDEAEKSTQMPAVLELARKASTGGIVKKFGQGMMKVRFCACFSAINPPVNKTADESRISFMTIKKNRRPTAMQEYNDLLSMIEETITPEFSNRMIARTLANMDVLFANIETFQKAARLVINGARASQVIGTMLGGLFLLGSTQRVTLEQAKEWIAARNWTQHTIIEEETDPVRLMQYIASCVLRFTSGGITKDMSIGDLIMLCHDHKDKDADRLLRYNGIAVKDGRVLFANRSPALARLLKDTDWSDKPTRMLENIEGAEKFKIFYFSSGVKTSGVSVPITMFFEKEEPQQKQIEIPLNTNNDLDAEIPF